MPEYLHPGVYIEETSYRGKPIQGVSTSTAGFVGAARKGQEGKPILVTSLNQYVRTFGSLISPTLNMGDYLGHSVKAFFDNGGSRVYIVRVLAADALKASKAINQGTVLRLPTGVTVRGPTATIPLNSLRNVDESSTLRVYTRSNKSAPFTETRLLQVQSYDAMRNRVTVVPGDALPDGVVLEPDNTFFLVQGVSATGTGPTFRAKNRGKDGNGIAVNIRPMDLPPVALVTRTAKRNNPGLGSLSGPITGSPTGIHLSTAALRLIRSGDRISVGSAENLIVDNIEPARVAFTVDIAGSYDGSSPGTVSLVSRGGEILPTSLELGTIPSGILDLTAPTPSPEPAFPHDIAAYLQPGDVVELDDTSHQGQITIGTVELGFGVLPVNPNVHLDAATPVTPDQMDATISVELDYTSNDDANMARLIVGDATVFNAPFRVGSLEPVSISNGADTESAEVLLVDAATNTLLVTKANPPAAGSFSTNVTVENWMTVESTQVAADGQTTVSVASTTSFYGGAKVELDSGTEKHECVVASVDPGARTVTFTSGLSLGGVGNYVDVDPDPAERKSYLRTMEIEVQVFENEVLKETFSRLSWNADTAADSYQYNFVTRINDSELGSRLVEIVTPIPAGSDLANQPTTPEGYPVLLDGGSNGSALKAIDIIGKDNGPGKRTGIEALAERDDISIVAVPGIVDENVQGALITHCERMKYRMAVLDGRLGQSDVSDIQAHRNNYDTKYAAYYAPWLVTLDPVTGKTITVPPSGHVIGIYARSDANVGVHKAPANEVVRNISDVEIPFNAAEQDVLNPVGINLIRDLTPRGIRVWGARTISSDQEWKYVNVRRLFIFLEHSIDLGTQWVVFEPNSESLWARVTETISAFLTGVWKSGALMGTTPEEAFFVTCDRSTMTQDDIDNGRLICEIGVAPVYPAEFVIFRIGQFTANAKS